MIPALRGKDAGFWPRAALLLLVFAGATYTTADADLWGHLRFGLDLLQSHHLTAVDPYSFTQDRPWINHEWLSELQTAIAWQLAGPVGLALLKGTLVFFVVLLFWSARRDLCFSAKLIVLIVMFAGTVHVTSSIRPQVWTFVCLGVLCRALLSESWRVKWWLPPLFCFWANCHGGWIVGLAALGAWAGVESLRDLSSLPGWALVVAASLAATLINPYGWDLWRFLAETVRPTRGAHIVEWEPLFSTPVLNWIPWIITVAMATWMALKRYPHVLATTAVLGILGYASFRVLRVESLFVEAAAILLAPAIARAWPAIARPIAVRSGSDRAALAFLTALPAGLALWALTVTLPCVPDISMFSPDLVATGALRSAEPGRIVTYFNWGQYAIWHFGPRLLVSMDGRRETVYTDARLAEADSIVMGEPQGMATLEKWRADYVWLPEVCTVARNWLASHGYRIEIETADSFIAVRDDHPRLVARPDPVGPNGRRCFPE